MAIYRIGSEQQSKALRLARTPDCSCLRPILWESDAICRIVGDIFPDNGLIQCATQQGVGLLDEGQRYGDIRFLVTFQNDCRLILKGNRRSHPNRGS